MGKTVRDEDVRFNLIINGNEAQAELYKLEKQTRDLTARNKELRAEKLRLEKAGEKESAAYKSVTAELKQNNTAIKGNKTLMQQLQKQIGITGLTMGQLRQRASQLRLQLNNMVPGSAQYIKLQADLKAVNTRITELSLRARTAESGLSRLAQGFNKYAALGASVIATGTGVVLSLQKMIDYNGKLSDAQSDVMKTTQMTKEEVDELTKSFGAMKTRTARMELLALAEEAGRLGITGTKNVKDFVEVANQMKVALGDILSDEQIREVGKLANVYKVGEETGRDFKEAMLSLGSALNEVGASGANTEDFLVNYLKRQAGVAVQAKVSAADNIGYAATFDEIGQSVEVSATAMNKVWMDMFKNTDTYARIAGMSVKDFTELLNTDSNEAMIRFLEGLNGNNEGLSVMVNKLSDLEVGGARGAQALSAIAGQTELLRKRQTTSNQALTEATSLTNEYEIKNNNLAATLEKVKRQLIGTFTSEEVVASMETIVNWFAKFIGATEDADGSVTKWRERLVGLLKIILLLITAVVSYNTALKLSALWTARVEIATKALAAIQSRTTVLTNLLRAATLLLSAAKAALQGNIVRAAAAMRLFNATMALTPWGAILAAIGAVAGAFILLKNRKEELLNIETSLEKVQKRADEINGKEIARIKSLVETAKSEVVSKEMKLKALEDLNKITGEYIENITLENIETEAVTKALAAYITMLEKKARVQAAVEELEILAEKELELRKQENAALEWKEKLLSSITTQEQEFYKTAIANASKYHAVMQGVIDKQKEVLYGILNEGGFLTNDENTSPTNTTPEADKNEAAKKRADELKKQQEELLKLNQDYFNRLLGLGEDNFRKELAQLDAQHQQRIADLSAKLQEAQSEYDKHTLSGDTEMASLYDGQIKALQDTMELADMEYNQKRSEILQAGIEDYLKTLETEFEREKVLRETAQNEQLAALGDNEEARKKLQEEFNKENLSIQAKHLEEVMLVAKEILNNQDFEGFDISILTDEQLQSIKDNLSELGLSIEQINLLLAQMQGKGGGENGISGLGNEGQTDILGFTIDQWSEMFSNLDTLEGKMQLLTMSLQGMQQAWAMYHQYVNASENKSYREYEVAMNKRRESLKKQLDSGYINQRQYDRAIAALEKEQEKRKAELEYKQAMRKWHSDLINAIVGVSMATINGFNTQPFFPLGIAMGALAGILGTIQVATIRKNKPVKGYEQGYYKDMLVRREQDGRMFNASFGGESRSGIVDKPTVFLAGEQGKNFPEMIIDGRTLKQFDPGLKDTLYREIGRIKGFENGFYQQQNQSSNEQVNALIAQNTMVMAQVAGILQKLDQDGITAVMDNDMRNLYRLRKEMRRMETIESKANLNHG